MFDSHTRPEIIGTRLRRQTAEQMRQELTLCLSECTRLGTCAWLCVYRVCIDRPGWRCGFRHQGLGMLITEV